MIDGCQIGPSWVEVERAAKALHAQGHENVATALNRLLRGENPVDAFGAGNLIRSRKAERDRLIGLLYIETYRGESRSMRSAAIALSRDWRDYSSRLAPRDLRLGGVPPLAVPARRRFFEIACLGCDPLCARSIRSILESDAFALLQAFHSS
ncbi:MAG: hypothetical protein NXH88_04620 [Hyphomonas sp.]|nr:hypothetical protein [Hyphomonas sp.]